MLQYTQNEVEKELSDYLRHSDRREISRITGIYESVVKGMMNPDDERKSAAFVYLQIQCALDEIDSERGEQFFRTVAKFRELSKQRNPQSNCLAHDTGKLSKEVSDCVFAHLQGKPFTEQLTEAIEAKMQIERLIDTLSCHIAQERQEIKSTYTGVN